MNTFCPFYFSHCIIIILNLTLLFSSLLLSLSFSILNFKWFTLIIQFIFIIVILLIIFLLVYLEKKWKTFNYYLFSLSITKFILLSIHCFFFSLLFNFLFLCFLSLFCSRFLIFNFLHRDFYISRINLIILSIYSHCTKFKSSLSRSSINLNGNCTCSYSSNLYLLSASISANSKTKITDSISAVMSLYKLYYLLIKLSIAFKIYIIFLI